MNGPTAKNVPTPSTSDGGEEYGDDEEHDDLSMPDLSDGSEMAPPPKKARPGPVGTLQGSGRARRKISYVDGDEDDEIWGIYADYITF